MDKLIIFLMFLGLAVNAQSKKELKEHNIKGITVYNYVSKLGKSYKIKDSYKEYNEKGYIVKNVEYNKEGKLKDVKKYYYNSDNNKVKEELFGANKKLEKTTTYTYKNGMKLSKKVVNSKGETVSKKEYEYLTF